MKNYQKVLVAGVAVFLVLGNSSSLGNPPTIIDKYSNGELMRHSTKRYGTRSLSSITHVIIHHSASLHHKAEDFARWHVNSRDWPGIGYHFIVEKNGVIIIGNPINLLSYHASPYNSVSIGICLSGNFELEQPTPEQLQSLDWLISDLQFRLKIHNGNQELKVLGHKEVRPHPTACPGKHLFNYIKKF